MQYNNLGDLQLAKQKIKYEAQKTFTQEVNNIINIEKNKAKHMIPIVTQQIKMEMLNALKTIGLSEFYTTFNLHYGDNNYDKNILRNSLSFNIDNNLRPQLSYVVKEFNTDVATNELKKRFNKNVTSDFDSSYSQEFEALDAINDIQFFGTLSSDIVLEDWVYDENSELLQEDVRNLQTRTIQVESKYIYEEAETLTIDKFLTYYNTTLKPKLEKKYGVKLG